MFISRRQTLTGGAAIAATAALPVPALADDAELYAALAEYRRLAAVHVAHQEANSRLYKNVRARFPEIERWHTLRHRHEDYVEAESCQICNDLHAACKPSWAVFNQALLAAGWDENEGEAEHETKMVAYDSAVAIPARTLAGLRAKIEMIDGEFVYPQDTEVAIGRADWDALLADTRRLAGEARS